jgi:hypothetical protein
VGRGWPFRCLARWRRGGVRRLRESSFKTRERCEAAARDRWKKDCVSDKSCWIVLLPLTANQVFWPICQGYQGHGASRDRHFVVGINYWLSAPCSSASIICVYPTTNFVKTCSPANLTNTGPGNSGMLRGKELRQGVCSDREFQLLRSFLLAHAYK